MTAQRTDEVLLDRKVWDLIGCTSEDIYDPAKWGITPQAITTDCWRGFYCRYEVQQARFLLQSVHFDSIKERVYPSINGRRPTKAAGNCEPSIDYNKLNFQLPFSGGVLIARDFIEDLYEHMGFQKPHRYRRVIELCIDRGEVAAQLDHSEQMETIRKKRIEEEQRNHPHNGDWIEYSFSLNYSI